MYLILFLVIKYHLSLNFNYGILFSFRQLNEAAYMCSVPGCSKRHSSDRYGEVLISSEHQHNKQHMLSLIEQRRQVGVDCCYHGYIE